MTFAYLKNKKLKTIKVKPKRKKSSKQHCTTAHTAKILIAHDHLDVSGLKMTDGIIALSI